VQRPFLGKRICYVLKDSPPAISVQQDVTDHDISFSYNRKDGPSATMPDGTVVYLDASRYVPTLNGYCKTCKTGPSKGTETSKMWNNAAYVCSPCGQSETAGTAADIAPTLAPPMAAKNLEASVNNSWSKSLLSSKSKPTPTSSISAQGRRGLCPERQRDGRAPNLLLREDEAIGDGHRSAASAVSANPNQPSRGNALTEKSYINLVCGPFFIEVFSGSGRLAQSVRDTGITVFEYDLTEQGGRRNLLHSSVLRELRELIAHPMCRGVWFGFPCGTFSSARRHDGGPPPLRGTNPKDTWGLP
jgi:hypothetical protein